MKICSINGCSNKYSAGDYCHKHYMRKWRHGDPLIKKKKHNRHGYKDHPLYQVWVGIKQRCYNKNAFGYKYWGERGIKICDEWVEDPKCFINWALNNGWEKGLEIDRIDNDKGYFSNNVRFVTHQKNMCNQRLLHKNNTSGYRGVTYDKRHIYNKKAIELDDGRPINDLSRSQK
jgi:hypothetical protein